MDELTLALESTFGFVSAHILFFVGIPLTVFTLNTAVSLVKIMCRPQNHRVTEKVSDKEKYVTPAIQIHMCPVADDCKNCRFYCTDKCLRGYLF